jgi:hypothetical protein
MENVANRVRMLKDLRFALDVMEERSHIGLDGKTALMLRDILLRRIVETEKALQYFPASEQIQMEELSAEEQLTA